MKRYLLQFTIVLAVGAAIFGVSRLESQPSSFPHVAGIRYVNSLPDSGAFPGELLVVVSSTQNTAPAFYTWDHYEQAWDKVNGIDGSFSDNATFSGTVNTGALTASSLSVTGSASLSGGASAGGTLTATNLTVNDVFTRKVLREDFGGGPIGVPYELYGNGSLTFAVTDTAEDSIRIYGSQIPLIGLRWEQAYAGGTDFFVDGYMLIDLDDADNDGVDLIFGDTRPQGVGGVNSVTSAWDEDLGVTAYCEASVKIADISETDSFYFGWRLGSDGYIDAGAWAGYNTSAYFVLSDNAGDLDIVTELNAGGSLNDDTGTTWADGNEKVLRVTLAPDSVSFTLDGTAVTQANAVLNADDGDRMICSAGWLNATGDATPDPDISFNYVEIGIQ